MLVIQGTGTVSVLVLCPTLKKITACQIVQYTERGEGGLSANGNVAQVLHEAAVSRAARSHSVGPSRVSREGGSGDR